MHSLEVIIATNQTPRQRERRMDISHIHGRPQHIEREVLLALKRASRRAFWERVHDAVRATLADEIDETIEFYGGLPSKTAAERMLLRLALEARAAGIDGPAEFPER